MISLIHIDYKRWLARSADLCLHVGGTLPEVTKALKAYGIQNKEIVAAIEELIRQGHNVAEFGINGLFTMTTKRADNELFRN